ATAEAFQTGKRQLELVPAIASPGPEHVSGQACRVKPDRHGPGMIWLADNDGNLVNAENIPKHHKTRGCPGCQWNGCFAGHRQWARRDRDKSIDRGGFDDSN